jgi:hypothetical protein
VKAARWAAVGLLVNMMVSAAFLLAKDRNPEWFIHFGSETKAVHLAYRTLGRDVLVPQRDGHDGREFWVIARDPFIRHPDVARRSMDRPAYRYQRIAYPALAAPWRWIGGEHALPWGLLATNLAAVFVGGYFCALLALRLGASARASLAFALSPGVITSVNLDVSDAVALAAVLAAVYLVLQRRLVWAVVAGVVAVLAKEPSLLALVGLAAFGGGSGALSLSRRAKVWLVGAPALAGLMWAGYVHLRIDQGRGSQEFTWPFAGYVDAYRRGWRHAGNWGDAAVALALIPLAAVVVWRWWQRRDVLMAAALPFVLLVPFFTAQVLDLADNTVRALAPAITLLWLDLYVPRPSASPYSRTAV